MSSPVRVRFAPSPTGYLHVGGARSLLFNYLFAKHFGGTLILRVEDTDQVRSTRESEEMQKADIRWLGLNWDEGPDVGGPYGPYRQSERLKIYDEHAQKLIADGNAYYCFCTDDELESKKQAALSQGKPPHYDGTCRHLPPADVKMRLQKGDRAAVRFWIKNPKAYKLNDLIRGEIEFQEGMVGDFVILRSGGMPVYNFCCVIDDALMKITHVFRAEEHLSNTVRQMMIYEALGLQTPQFGHISIILGSDKQKLSKRHGATSINEYRLQGYFKDAVNNYLALLGWSSPEGKEVMSLEDMCRQFTVDRVNPAPAVFDGVKMKWMNSVYLRSMDHKVLWKELEPFLKEAGLDFSDHDDEWKDKALTALKTAFETLLEAVPLFIPLNDANFKFEPDAQPVLGWPTSKKVVETWKGLLEKHPEKYISGPEFEALQKSVQESCAVKGKELFQPMRVAIVGKPHGTELKQLVPLLPVKSLIRRANKTLEAM